MAKNQKFMSFGKMGYSVVCGKNKEPIAHVEYMSQEAVTKISGKKPPKGYRYIYVIDATSYGEANETSKIRLNIGQTENNVWNRYEPKIEWRHNIINVFLSSLTDTQLHELIDANEDITKKHLGKKDGVDTHEFFDLYSHEDCENLMTCLEKWTSGISAERETMELYEDTNEKAKEAAQYVRKENANGNSPHLGGNICCRGGKTAQNVATWTYTPAKHMILTNYVGTVQKGYHDLIECVKGYENIKIVDATNAPTMTKAEKDKILEEVSKHLMKSRYNRILWMIPLTGTNPKEEGEEKVDLDDFNNTFDNRSAWIISFLKNRVADEGYVVSNDEVDFGSACEMQVKKIAKLCEIGGYAPLYKMSLSGTNAHNAEKIWGKVDYSIDKDYIDLHKIVEENK